MARVKLNPSIEEIRGKVGEMVYKHPDHTQIIARMPPAFAGEPSANQVAQHDKFRLAALYGKAVMADVTQKAIYTEKGKSKGVPAFALAVADFLNAPTVAEIDLSGYTGHTADKIKVRAVDDVRVQGVAVTIRDQDGDVLEQGAAVWTLASGTWNYTATTNLQVGQAVSIEVTATDLPGHQTTRTQPHS